MIGEFITGLGLSALKEVNDATVRIAVVIELQESILTAREKQTALIERVKELEQQVWLATSDGMKKSSATSCECSGIERSPMRSSPTRLRERHVYSLHQLL